jgi:hypothetical protein
MTGDRPPDDTENRKPKTENRNWVWFFAALVVLGAASVSINWAYNARQQLTMEQLTAAQDRWIKAGPADYDLVIDKTIQSGAGAEPNRDRIEVEVRKNKVVAASLNGAPIKERRIRDEYDMPGWLDAVERFLQIDTAPGAPRTFRSAEFDPVTGQLRHFTRSVSTTRERQELVLTMTPAKGE